MAIESAVDASMPKLARSAGVAALNPAVAVGKARGAFIRSAYSGSGASSPGQAAVNRSKPWRAPWSKNPLTSRKIAPSSESAIASFK
jgi:hypothetical protein